MLMVISFYFGQKVGESKADPLVDWDDEEEQKPSAVWFNLEETEEDE